MPGYCIRRSVDDEEVDGGGGGGGDAVEDVAAHDHHNGPWPPYAQAWVHIMHKVPMLRLPL